MKSLSPRLFWDTDPEKVDMQKHKAFVIARVLEYGTFDDWKTILKYYGLEDIAETATKLRTLDKKTLAFISTISGIAKEKFRCYSNQQSTNQHFSF